MSITTHNRVRASVDTLIFLYPDSQEKPVIPAASTPRMEVLEYFPHPSDKETRSPSWTPHEH